QEAMKKVEDQVKLPASYHIDWAGEYESQVRAQRRLMIIIPLTLLLIFANVAVAPIGGILALYLTGVNFSVSSGVGFLALFGVSVQTGVIMVEYINQLRARGHNVIDAAE